MTVIDTSLTDESTPLLEENDLDEQIPVKKSVLKTVVYFVMLVFSPGLSLQV